jgi:uncharacterized protein YPO0396
MVEPVVNSFYPDTPQASLFPATETPASDASFLLTELEVFNWGPFSGMHRTAIDPLGTAIIGPTGSGKTTLIDALMTLLVEQPRYNLASTGGHESDRTLISYVRGVLGGDGSDGEEAVARPAATITGLCATYDDGKETLKLAALLWTDGSSNAAQDLKRRWIFSQAAQQSLEQWLKMLHEGGARELMRHGRDTGKLRIFDSKRAYLAHTRKFFDVGDNAFTLLNRAAGLKQLNSIDDIFRDLVLEDRSAFDRALEVAGEFDNLADIHKELEIAKAQQESLVPISLEYKKLERTRGKTKSWRALKRLLPVWYAMAAEQRWLSTQEDIKQQLHSVQNELQAHTARHASVEVTVNTLREKYLTLGGNIIAELENTIDAQKDRAADIRKHADTYLHIVRSLQLATELSAHALQQNQQTLTAKRSDYQQQRDDKHNETLTAHSQLRDVELQATDTEETLRKVKARPGSNIPPKFQDFRAELARELSLADDDLPFVAELIEVKAEESAWRGAIERAIGSERLRILVPDTHLSAALRWVNHRDNRLHVRLQRASTNTGPSEFFHDGYSRKLQFKTHPLREAVKALIASRDRHCVDNTDALKTTEHAMTIQGMMSGRGGQFEKQDQRSLLADWMTGFDNKDQLQSLATRLQECKAQSAHWKKVTAELQQALKEHDASLVMIDRVLELSFSSIDLPGAEAQLLSSQQRLQSLLAPDSDSSKAKAAYDLEKAQLDTLAAQIQDISNQQARLHQRLEDATEELTKSQQRKGEGLGDNDIALAQQHLPIDSAIEAKQLDNAERTAAANVENKLQKLLDRMTESERRLIAMMGRAQQADTGALTECGTDLADIPDYLERLRVLNEEALPEKTSRFLEYLNRSSDQGVTQLLSSITEEVDGIEQRLADLNDTLKKVDFRSGRFLQLAPQRIKHERLRALETAQRKLRSAALNEDNGQSHYTALRELVEILRDAGQNRRQVGSRALLDPRYRLQFFVVEVNRQTGDRSPPRTGSQSGSGGEKELMASHILTASLSYALCPSQASHPLYATVILDEAFSKSSPSAANRIIDALRIFKLHPIFVTPNKEIGLLKKHTRKVICVQRPGARASLASITWEQLDDMARTPRTR